MVRKVAVDDGLSGIDRVLRENGYRVVRPGTDEDVMAIVVSGMSNNMMNMQETRTRVPVIEASGSTPEEVMTRIEELLP